MASPSKKTSNALRGGADSREAGPDLDGPRSVAKAFGPGYKLFDKSSIVIA